MGTEKNRWTSLIAKFSPSVLVFIFFTVLAAILYWPSFQSFFFQDDWFTFKISQAVNVVEFLHFFQPREDVIYYRPLGMQVYFFIMHHLVGFTAIYYRISSLFFYVFHGLLIYQLLKTLKLNITASLCSATFFICSATTYIPFFWSATFPFILGPFLSTLCLYLFLIHKKIKYGYLLSFIAYLLASLTLENSISIPFILAVYLLLHKNFRSLPKLAIFVIPQFIIFTLRLYIFKVPFTGVYTPSFRILSTLRNYLYWTFNWPEEISRQFTQPLSINNLFIKDFSLYFQIWTYSSLALFLIMLFLIFIFIFQKYKDKKNLLKYLLLGIAWYSLVIVPLLVFADHTFPYYLPLAQVGASIILAVLLTGAYNTLGRAKTITMASIIIFLYLLSGITTVTFSSLTHWAPRRAKLSEKAIFYLKHELSPGDNAVVKTTEEYRLPLNNQDSLNLFFGPAVKAIYPDNPEYLTPPPVGFKEIHLL